MDAAENTDVVGTDVQEQRQQQLPTIGEQLHLYREAHQNFQQRQLEHDQQQQWLHQYQQHQLPTIAEQLQQYREAHQQYQQHRLEQEQQQQWLQHQQMLQQIQQQQQQRQQQKHQFQQQIAQYQQIQQQMQHVQTQQQQQQHQRNQHQQQKQQNKIVFISKVNAGVYKFENYLRYKKIRFNILKTNSPNNAKYHSYKVEIDKDCDDIYSTTFWPVGVELKVRPWRQKIINRNNSVNTNSNEATATDVWDVRPHHYNN